MPDNNFFSRPRRRRLVRQGGSAAVEFALVAMVFISLIFGSIELARLMYLYNTLQEVTRRAAQEAANTDPTDLDELDRIRMSAVFRTTAGSLAFSGGVTDGAVRVEYMSIQRNPLDGSFTRAVISNASTISGAQNRTNCVVNPYGTNCIRLVQVRVCQTDNTTECDPIEFQAVIPLLNLSLPLPRATTIVKAESLGLMPGG